MDTSYLKLNTRSRMQNYLGLEMTSEEIKPVNGKNYLHLDIPVRGVISDDGVTYSKIIKRNQHVWVAAEGTVDVKGHNFIEVEPNQELAEMGSVQGLYRIHPGSGKKELGFWFTARKDCDLSDIQYAVRLYMPA